MFALSEVIVTHAKSSEVLDFFSSSEYSLDASCSLTFSLLTFRKILELFLFLEITPGF